jgi:hypothetical protein
MVVPIFMGTMSVKLQTILFENSGVSDADIISGIAAGIGKGSTGFNIETEYSNKNPGAVRKYTPTQNKQKAAKMFFDQNSSEFASILSSASKFKYLGAGSYGLAFDTGDKVLKIEIAHGSFSGGERANKSLEALWGSKGKSRKEPGSVGGAVPMIYDRGTMNFGSETYDWILMEKFETVETLAQKEGIEAETEKVIDFLFFRFDGRKESLKQSSRSEQVEIAKAAKQDALEKFESEIKLIGEKMRLEKGWLGKLVQHMMDLIVKGFDADFHIGNVGIRRSGGEGYLVFYD